MSAKGSGTFVRPLDESGAINEKSGTQLFPAPLRAAVENIPRRAALSSIAPGTGKAVQAGSAPSKWASLGGLVRQLRASSVGTPGVSMLVTVGVGGTAPPLVLPASAVASPPVSEDKPSGKPALERAAIVPPRPATPPREVNLGTQIFSTSSVVPAARGRASQLAQTFAAPVLSAPPGYNGLSLSGEPRGEGSPPLQTGGAPLLRAFDDGRPRAATWSTAKTITAALIGVEQKDTNRRAQAAPSQPRGLASSAVVFTRRILAGRLVASARGKRLAALAVGAALFASLGLFVAQNRSETPSEHHLVEALPDPPRAAPANDTPALVSVASPEPPTRQPPAVEVAGGKPSLASDGRGQSSVSLARQAVDALLAGDRPKARQFYRELSRQAPDVEAYREAVRLLAPSESDAPR